MKRKSIWKNTCERHGLLFAVEECPSCQLDAWMSIKTQEAFENGLEQGYKRGYQEGKLSAKSLKLKGEKGDSKLYMELNPCLEAHSPNNLEPKT